MSAPEDKRERRDGPPHLVAAAGPILALSLAGLAEWLSFPPAAAVCIGYVSGVAMAIAYDLVATACGWRDR